MYLDKIKYSVSLLAVFFALSFYMLIAEVNVDTIQRISSLQGFFYDFQIIDVITSELIPQLFFFFLFVIIELDPFTIRLLFVYLAIFIFLFLFRKNPFFLLFLAITPFGHLMIFNITSFFIASCFVIKLGIHLTKNNPSFCIASVYALLAFMFHWASFILVFCELLFFLCFIKRPIIKQSVYNFLFFIICLVGFYFTYESFYSKLNSYANSNISYNKYHFIMLFIYPLTLVFLTFFNGINKINLVKNFFLVTVIFIFYIFGYMKIASRLLFFIDFALIFCIYEYISIKYFRGKKEYLI